MFEREAREYHFITLKITILHPRFQHRYGWGPYIRNGDIGVVREFSSADRVKIDFDVARGWVGHPQDLEVVSPPLVVIRCFDVESGTFEDIRGQDSVPTQDSCCCTYVLESY